MSCSNVNDAANMFQSMFSNVCNRHAPLKKKRVREKKSPWLNNDVIKLMRERDKLKKKAVKSGNNTDWSHYRVVKNKVNSEIKRSKQSYVCNNIKTSGNNTKKVWDTIRQVIPNKRNNTNISCLKNENVNVTEPNEIADIMNNFFASIGPKLAAEIPVLDDDVDRERLSNCVENPINSFEFSPVSLEYVFDKLSSLPEKKATGTDDLPAKLLKVGAISIAEPLTYIVNLSLRTCVFPNIWKNARICPIHKGGDSTDPSNYRPISILPVMSKIIERVVF